MAPATSPIWGAVLLEIWVYNLGSQNSRSASKNGIMITKLDLMEIREQIQDDISCYLDGLQEYIEGTEFETNIIEDVQNIIISKMKVLFDKLEK